MLVRTARDPRPAGEKIASCLTNLQLALDLALDVVEVTPPDRGA
jgi:hypothetical protein